MALLAKVNRTVLVGNSIALSNASIESGAINGFRLHPAISTSGVSVFKGVITAFLECVACVANRHSGIAVRDGT